jgi:hypothetical protein
MGCGNWEYICGFDNVIKCIYYIYLLQKDMDVNSRDPLQNIIPFRVKGVEIGRFDSSGNLKIGTTTTTAPTVRLDISGGEARVNSGSATSTAITTTGRIGVNQPSPTVDLDVSGVSRMAALSATSTALTTTGRIGVNTAAPTVDLDVTGAARLTASSATNTALTTVGRIGVNTASPSVDLDVTGAARMSALSATSTALTTTGRIGVNTASPTVDLDVTGIMRASTGLILGTNTTAMSPDGCSLDINNSIIALSRFTSGGNGMAIGVHRPSGGNVSFITNETATPMILGTTGQERIRITADGKVGIGTNNPTVALDVTGVAKITGNLDMSSTGKIVNLVTPTAAQEAATKGYVDTLGTSVTRIDSENYVHSLALIRIDTVSPINGGITRANVRVSAGGAGGPTFNPSTQRLSLENADITGSLNINNCKPRIAVNVSSSPGLNVSFNIPPALRSGGLIANKVYFTIRVPSLSSGPTLYLKPNGSASIFHSFTQQFTGSSPVLTGTTSSLGFRLCNILNNTATAGGGYHPPIAINIVGEFTIIRDTQNFNATTNPPGYTTRLYGTLVQYGNLYIQKWDFQGQAVNGGDYDMYDRIDSFLFTSDNSYGNDNSVSVTIEGD